MTDVGSPMNGITVSLHPDYNGDGVADAGAMLTDVTDFVGYFEFTNVEPADYVLIETQLAGYSNESDIDTSITALDLDGDDSADGPDNDIPCDPQSGRE